MNRESVDRARAWLDRYGGYALFLGRITPVVRSFISIPAGVLRSPVAAYTLSTLLGSLVWSLGLAALGWGLAASWARVHHAFRDADYAAAAAVAVALIGAAAVRRRRVRT